MTQTTAVGLINEWQQRPTFEEKQELVTDMSQDILNRAAQESKQLHRRVEKYGKSIVASTCLMVGPSVKLDGGDYKIPNLFPEDQAERLHGEIEWLARKVGDESLHHLFQTTGGIFEKRLKFNSLIVATRTNGQEQLQEYDTSRFVDDIWAPDYADRFVDAWHDQLYPSPEQVLTNTILTEMERRPAAREAAAFPDGAEAMK